MGGLLLLLGALVASGVFEPPARGASASSTVGARVLASTQLGVAACPPAARTFGMVWMGSLQSTSDCTLAFGSTNTTTQLRIAQRDGYGVAMTSDTGGAIDPSFNGGAVQTFNDAFASEHVLGAAVQSDGKVVLAGTSSPAVLGNSAISRTLCQARRSGLVRRLTTTGVLDPTFGTAGTTTLSVGSTGTCLMDMVLQPDGKVLVSGNAVGTGSGAFVARLTATGALDPTWNGTGVNGGLGYSGYASQSRLAIDSSGRVYLAYTTNNIPERLRIRRYTTAGALDTTWAASGIRDVGNMSWPGDTLLTQTDGSLLIGHQGAAFRLRRYTAGGALDTAGFGVPNGYIDVPKPAGSRGDVALQTTGLIVHASLTPAGAIELTRYTTAGVLDGAFGTQTHVLPSGYTYGLVRVASDSSDRILVLSLAGHRQLVTRFAADGTLDTTYGTNGTATWDDGVRELQPAQLAVASDGSTVVGGHVANEYAAWSLDVNGDPVAGFGTNGLAVVTATLPGDERMLTSIPLSGGGAMLYGRNRRIGWLRKILPDGTPDPAFGTGGRVDLPHLQRWLPRWIADGPQIARDDEGRWYIATQYGPARLLADGSPDPDWADGGVPGLPALAGGYTDMWAALATIAIDRRGGAIMVAESYGGPAVGFTDPTVIRYDTTGRLDLSFGQYGAGFGTAHVSGAGGYLDGDADLLIDLQGRIYYSGATDNDDGFIVRFNEDGTHDTTYGETSGTTNWSNKEIKRISLDSQGRIVAVLSDYWDETFLERLDANGVRDPAFVGGIANYIPGLSWWAFGEVQGGDRILLWGYDTATGNPVLRRMLPNGTPDPSFGVSGEVEFDTGSTSEDFVWVSQSRDGAVTATLRRRRADGHDELQTIRFIGREPIPDYDRITQPWSGPASSSAFGACLHAVAAGATTDAGTWTPVAGCPLDDTPGTWQAVPISSAIVARAGDSVANATATLRFAYKVGNTQAAGIYVAPLTFEVLAPSA